MKPRPHSCSADCRRTLAFRASLLSLVFAAVALALPSPRAFALPTGGQVAAGQVTTTVAGSQLTLDQTSRTAIMNWQQFNIAPNELVRVLQSGPDAALLARVTGGDPSQLLGQLKADGKLFLINPKGVLVGQGAAIDTAVFMASTLDVADRDFLQGGPLTFKGDSGAGVVNLGKITAREGNVLLLAHTVENAGEISAARGTAGLAAGTEIYLASPDAPAFVVKSNLAATHVGTGVDNRGVIAAAQAQLEAAGGSIYDLAVNQSGRVQVTGIERQPDGRVLLTARGGTVGVSGSVSARAADGSGGEILVGGDYQGKNAAVANAANTVVTSTGSLDAGASSAAGSGGRAIVWADENTRFLGALRAGGATGGFAEVSGKEYLDFRPGAAVDLGPGGTLLLDPNSLRIGNFPDENSVSQNPGPPYVFGGNDSSSRLSVATLEGQLANTNVVLDTSTRSGDITFEGSVSWATAHTLRVTSGNNIVINDGVNLTGAAGKLELLSGRRGAAYDQLSGAFNLTGDILQAGGTITVDTLTVGQNTAANYAEPVSHPTIYDDPSQSGNATFNGVLNVNVLEKDVSANTGNLTATNAGNAIGTFRTTGSGGKAGDIDVRDGAGNLGVMLQLPDQWSNRIRVVTAGDLTLEAGTAISFADFTRDVVFAADGGAFINAAGASAIGANSRHLIYTSTAAATGKGGLGGVNVGNHPYDANETFADTISRFFFTGAAPTLPNLTYAANNVSRAYGDANPANFGFTVTGYDAGIVNDVTGTPSLSTSATLTSGVGGYAISIAPGTLQSLNYGFVFVPGSLNVTAAPVTIGISNATRLYGAANPAFAGTYTTGLKNSDPLSALGTWSFGSSATATSNVGGYAITGSTSGASANYAVSFTPGTLSVTPAPLTLAVDNATRQYGAANPGFSATPTGLMNGESLAQAVPDLAFATSATANAGVGGHAITGSGTSTNYTLSFTPGTLSITPAPLVITASDASRTYGDANPQFAFTTTGLLNGDSDAVVSGLSYVTAATAASGIGNYAVTPAGGSAANYALSYAPGTLSVGRANLDVTIADLLHPYGRANPAYSLAGLVGLKNSDTADVIRNLTFSTTTPFSATALPGTHFTIVASGTTDNYALAWTAGLLTMVRAPATIAVNSISKTYGDGLSSIVPTYVGFLPGDESAARSTWGLANPDAIGLGAGSYPLAFVVNHADLAASLGLLYEVTLTPGTLTVVPAPLTVQVFDASRIYGDANPAFAAGYSGFRNNDTPGIISGLTLATTATASSAAGQYAITASGAVAPNYTIQYQPGALTVAKAPLTVGFSQLFRDYGDENPDFSQLAFVRGLRGSDVGQAAAILQQIAFSTAATSSSPAGNYTVLADTSGLANYDLTLLPSTLQVLKAPLVVSFAPATREYGAANPQFEIATVTGLKNGEQAADVLGNLPIFSSLSPQAGVGTYRTALYSTQQPDNYYFERFSSSFTITPAPLTVTGNSYKMTYGNSLPAFGYTVTGLKPWDQPGVVTNVQFGIPVTNASPAGVYPIPFVSAGQAANYAITALPGTLEVARRPLVYSAVPVSIPAGVLPNTFSVDGPRGVDGGPVFSVFGQADAFANSSPGKYTITPVLALPTGSSREEFDRYYEFEARPARLTLTETQVVSIILTQGPIETTLMSQDFRSLDDFKDAFDLQPDTHVGVSAPMTRNGVLAAGAEMGFSLGKNPTARDRENASFSIFAWLQKGGAAGPLGDSAAELLARAAEVYNQKTLPEALVAEEKNRTATTSGGGIMDVTTPGAKNLLDSTREANTTCSNLALENPFVQAALRAAFELVISQAYGP